MKKTLLITLEFPPFAGGVGYYYFNLVKRLPANKIIVLTNDKYKFFEKTDFKVYQKKLITSLPIWPKWILTILKTLWLIKKEGIELLWAGQVLPLGTICLIIKKFFNIPYIVSLHGTDIFTALKSKRKKKLLLKILNESFYITANSKFTKNEILKLGLPNEKIIIIYPCANDLNTVSQDQLANFKYKNDLVNKKILLSVGRLVPRKNFEAIIKTIPEVQKIFSNLKYFIIGSGPQKNDLKLLIKHLGLENTVEIKESVTNENLSFYYMLADIFLLTPKSIDGEIEGLGMVFLEASLFAKPIIASANGGIPEVVLNNKTGLLVNPKNIQQISQLITKLLKDSNLSKKLGENAREFVIRNFHWSKETDKLLNILS